MATGNAKDVKNIADMKEITMSNNFEEPKGPEGPPVNCQVVGIKEGSAKRELLFESTDYQEFLKAYKYYYQSGEYVMVLKEYNNKSGGIK